MSTALAARARRSAGGRRVGVLDAKLEIVHAQHEGVLILHMQHEGVLLRGGRG